MRLIQFDDQNALTLVECFGKKPPYAILSHTWGCSIEEVSHKDLLASCATTKKGFEKLTLCRDQARLDGLEYFWIDSVCIDRSNAVELQESIISMFRWYQEAAICYVYMADVSVARAHEAELTVLNTLNRRSALQRQFCQSRWFTRGWTLQELLAPSRVKFFSREGIYLGDKSSLEPLIHHASGIPVQALRGRPLSQFSVQTRLSWAVKRTTTRQEDAAYSLASLFDVYMSHRYGEGREAAMHRLQRKIEKEHRQVRPSQLKTNSITALLVLAVMIALVMAFTQPPHSSIIKDPR